MFIKLFSLIFIAFSLSITTVRVEAYKEASGYVTVRSEAHMFWWLYYANSSNNSHTNAYLSYPLVIWLQGGPGGSSTGFGNFQEIGPQDVNLNERKTSWLKYANLLFIDNPVGTGYSYVSNSNAYARNNEQIAKDLVQLLKQFYEKAPEFKTIPLYIFSESYGGKMTTGFAVELYHSIQNKQIECNFKGIALGDSWISPIDSMASWGPYLYSMSFVDKREQDQLQVYIDKTRDALKRGDYKGATDLWTETEMFVEQITDNVNFYNILQGDSDESSKSQFYSTIYHMSPRLRSKVMRYTGALYENDLNTLMNGPIKTKLNIPASVTWGEQSGTVFAQLEGDFMLPVVDQIDYLLNHTNIKVVVYSGQLDLIVDTIGTLNWMSTMKWPGYQTFKNTQKHPISEGKVAVAFYKSYSNLSFYWILKAGHMVPTDAGNTALKMLQKILQSN